MVEKYPKAPEKGDLIWLDLNPAKGHEQAGMRPALVVSPRSFNTKVGLAFVCPITSQIKGYPFEVAISAKEVAGVVLVDQLRSVDWQVRRFRRIAAAPAEVVARAQSLLEAILLD